MTNRTTAIAKLEAVYISLTATIMQFSDSHPDIVDTIALPMMDFENVLNELQGHGEAPTPAHAKGSKTH